MPKEEKITRKEGVRAEIAPTRSVKKLFSLAHERATRAIVSVSLATALASCSPAVSQAQDTTPAKGKPVAAAVDKKPVEFVNFSDPKDLQPFFDAAMDKIVSIKPGETKQWGPYKVKITWAKDDISMFTIVPNGETKEYDVGKYNPYQNVNIILLDMGDNSPIFKGPTLVFADNKSVHFIYFDKTTNKYEGAVVKLEDGGIRSGPTNVGVEILGDGGLSVFTAPKRLITGDVVGRADGNPDGSLGYLFFKFTGPSEPGLIAANK